MLAFLLPRGRRRHSVDLRHLIECFPYFTVLKRGMTNPELLRLYWVVRRFNRSDLYVGLDAMHVMFRFGIIKQRYGQLCSFREICESSVLGKGTKCLKKREILKVLYASSKSTCKT